MIKKSILLALTLIAVLGVFSFSLVNAQEEELPSCDMMEMMANMESMMEPLTALGELSTLSEGAGASDFTAMVAEIDAYAWAHWETLAEGEIECAEEYYIAYQSGLILDELLITTALSALSVHESEAGNSDAVTALTEQATARSESLSDDTLALTDALTNMMTGEMDMGEEFDACSEEDMEALAEGVGTINEAYMELGAALDGASGADLTAIVVGFATLSSEYWDTFMPEVPECAEAQTLASHYGHVLDDSLIMVTLLRLAELEAEAGNDDVAETLADSASARAEALSAAAEEIFGSEEE